MNSRQLGMFLTLTAVLLICSCLDLYPTDRNPRQLLSPSAGLDHSFKFERLTVDDGLSENAVTCILQDRQGFLWFGTHDGLNRYDGHQCTIYRHDLRDQTTISDSIVMGLYEDHAGLLWIITETGGLNAFNRDEQIFSRFQNDADGQGQLTGGRVLNVFEENSGELWVSTEAGLNRFNREEGRFTCYFHSTDKPRFITPDWNQATVVDRAKDIWIGSVNGLNRFHRPEGTFTKYLADLDDPTSLSNDHVVSLFEDGAGELWVGTFGGGLCRLDRERGTFTRYRHDPSDPASLSHDQVRLIGEDSAGDLWVGTEDGLNRFDRERGTFTRFLCRPATSPSLSHNAIRSFFPDSEGTLWVGIYGGGLAFYDRKTETFRRCRHDPDDPQSLVNDRVVFITEDRTGNIWVATEGGGLNKLDRRKTSFVHYRHQGSNPRSLSHDFITAIHEDSTGAVWVGTAGGGLNRLNPETGEFIAYRHDPADSGSVSDDQISTICEDSYGTLWIGTRDQGFNRFDRQNETFVAYPGGPDDQGNATDNRIESLFGDSRGYLWVGTAWGRLIRFDPRDETRKCFWHEPGNRQSRLPGVISAFLEDRSGYLWLASGKGISRFNPETESFASFSYDPRNPTGISHTNAWTFCESRSGTLWVGTYGGGLNRLDRKSGEFTVYTAKDGLANNVVYGILEDDQGNLWISTNNGISKFDPRSGSFRNYDVRDGLQGNEFNTNSHCRSSDGRMYFGGINGLSAFYPEQVQGNKQIPAIAITSFRIFNEAVPLAWAAVREEGIVLTHDQDFFSFEFAALDFSIPQKNRYAYRMEGFHDDWIHTLAGQRSASFINLAPGKYTFRVKGSNNDGVWNEEGVAVRVTVLPPLWLTWWAKALYAIALLSLLFGGYRYRVRQLRRRAADLSRMVRERTRELSSKTAVLSQTTDKLSQTNEDLGKANELKSELLRVAAHDLKHPLQNIILHARSLERLAEEESNRGRLQAIGTSAEQMVALISELLENAVIERGALVLKKTSFDLGVPAALCVEAFQGAAEEKNQRLEIERLKGCLMEGDRMLVQEIIQNLVSNAVKFSPRGGLITVSVGRDGSGVYCSVWDNGPGLTEDDRRKVFGRFQRLSAKPTGGEHSTGLGLAIARDLVHLHQGEIGVESEAGQGCTFTVQFPAG